jgi:hypothetical protein
VPAQLPVHVNRNGLHSLEVPERFETADSFDVRLINHGEAVHVHLHLDDALSTFGSIDANNHYVKADSERLVQVQVAPGGSGLGKLKVATSYGAETRYVDVDVVEPDDGSDSVRVDESLAKPQPRPEPEPGLIDDSRLPVLALGLFAVSIAAIAAFALDGTVVPLGAIGVVLAVALATYVVFLVE